MANRFFIKPRMLHPRIARLFRHCNSKDVVYHMNCYGAAVQQRLQPGYHNPQPGYFSQGYRDRVFKFDLERVLSFRLYARYMALADGHIPLTPEQAEKLSPRHHVFAGVTVGSDYHFYFRSRHEHEGRLVWLHKMGGNELSHQDAGQEVITNIAQALKHYVDMKEEFISDSGIDDGVIGYFKFPKYQVLPSQKTPPRYTRQAVQEMAKIFHAYMDAREQVGAGYSSRITEANVILNEFRYKAPGEVKKVKAMLELVKLTGAMPHMFKPIASSTHALQAEIKVLGLAEHPEMKTVMTRLEAKKNHARRVVAPSKPTPRRAAKPRVAQARKLQAV